MIYIYQCKGTLESFFNWSSCFAQPFTDPRYDAEFVDRYNLLATFELK